MKLGFLTTSYRRQLLDRDLMASTDGLEGLVLDLGGEKERRGSFRLPQRDQLWWLCINIDRLESPEILATVAHVPLRNGCADVVVCTEVLEHVPDPFPVICESYRLLRCGGLVIISMPFLYHVHADPYDYQRYTATKLAKLLMEAGFEEIEIKAQGYYFTVLADMVRDGLNQFRSRVVRWPLAIFVLPFIRLMIYMDSQPWVRNSPRLSSYTTGYFVQARKSRNN
jgi:SAM-dependent methyltransferase